MPHIKTIIQIKVNKILVLGMRQFHLQTILQDVMGFTGPELNIEVENRWQMHKLLVESQQDARVTFKCNKSLRLKEPQERAIKLQKIAHPTVDNLPSVMFQNRA